MTSMESNISAFLRGFGDFNPSGLRLVSTCHNWPDLARAEIERRMTALIQTFTYQELLAVASGEVSLSKLATAILSDERMKSDT